MSSSVSEQKALIVQRNSKDIEEEDRASGRPRKETANITRKKNGRLGGGGGGWREEQCLGYEIGSGSFKRRRERKRCDVRNGGRLAAKDKRFARTLKITGLWHEPSCRSLSSSPLSSSRRRRRRLSFVGLRFINGAAGALLYDH